MLFTSNFARLSPKGSAKFALKYLFKPYSRREYDFRTKTKDLETHTVQTIKGKIALHEFKASGDQHVLLSHGWADTSTRFTHLIDKLVSEGVNVWSLDHIGHGKSETDTAHLFGFFDGVEKAVNHIEKRNHKLSGIVGHSMGALAVLLQHEQILLDKKIVMSSAPTKFFENLFINTKKFGVSNRMLLNSLNHVAEVYQRDWQELSPEKHSHKINESFLMVHDKDDPTCSYENFQELVDGTKHEFMTTNGLGHLKILKDERVLNKITDFIRS